MSTFFAFLLLILSTFVNLQEKNIPKEYVVLNNPKISNFKKSLNHYSFYLGSLDKNSYPFIGSSFLIMCRYKSSILQPKCNVMKNLLVECSFELHNHLEEGKLEIVQKAYNIRNSKRMIIVGKDEEIIMEFANKEMNELKVSQDLYYEDIEKKIKNVKSLINENMIYAAAKNRRNLSNSKNGKIAIGITFFSLHDGDIQRYIANLANHLINTGLYNIYILTGERNENDYYIDNRISIVKVYEGNQINERIFLTFLENNKLDIIIVNTYWNKEEINYLTKAGRILRIKTILIIHTFFMHRDFIVEKDELYNYYKEFKKFDCLIHITPNEDFIWKRLNISSYHISNIPEYNYNEINSSSLTNPTLLLLGQGKDNLKRFDLGIRAMESIIKDVPEAKLLIVSDDPLEDFVNLVRKLNLTESVEFHGPTSDPEIYFRKASIHLLLSDVEDFWHTLYKAKSFGLANIVTEKRYMELNKEGTVIVPRDDPEAIAKEAVRLLKDYDYRVRLGREGKESLKNFLVEDIVEKWNGLLYALKNGTINELIQSQYYNESESYEILQKEMKFLFKKHNEMEDRYEKMSFQQIMDRRLVLYKDSFIHPDEKDQYLGEKKYFRNLSSYNDFIESCLNHEILIPEYYRSYRRVNPLISIIIPCFNCQPTVLTTLVSVMNQYLHNIEIIVVNDGSSDNSMKVVEELERLDRRIILLKNSINMGTLYSRYRAIMMAKGKYILSVDSDDLYATPFILNKLYNNVGDYDSLIFKSFHKHNQNFFLSKSEIDLLDNEKNLLKKEYSRKTKKDKIPLGFIQSTLWSNFVRRKTYLEAYELLNKKYLFIGISRREDEITNVLLSEVINKVKFTRIYGYLYNLETSWIVQFNKYSKEKESKLIRDFLYYLEISYKYNPFRSLPLFFRFYIRFKISTMNQSNKEKALYLLEKYCKIEGFQKKIKLLCPKIIEAIKALKDE